MQKAFPYHDVIMPQTVAIIAHFEPHLTNHINLDFINVVAD